MTAPEGRGIAGHEHDGKTFRILHVSTGNVCRSPYIERLLAREEKVMPELRREQMMRQRPRDLHAAAQAGVGQKPLGKLRDVVRDILEIVVRGIHRPDNLVHRLDEIADDVVDAVQL